MCHNAAHSQEMLKVTIINCLGDMDMLLYWRLAETGLCVNATGRIQMLINVHPNDIYKMVIAHTLRTMMTGTNKL